MLLFSSPKPLKFKSTKISSCTVRFKNFHLQRVLISMSDVIRLQIIYIFYVGHCQCTNYLEIKAILFSNEHTKIHYNLNQEFVYYARLSANFSLFHSNKVDILSGQVLPLGSSHLGQSQSPAANKNNVNMDFLKSTMSQKSDVLFLKHIIL